VTYRLRIRATAAASDHRRATKHHVDVLSKEAEISTRGTQGAPGSSSIYAGVLSGSLDDGASAWTISFGQNLKFTGIGTEFYPRGSVRLTETGQVTVHPDGTVTSAGTDTIIGGTGAFKGARGRTAFESVRPVHVDEVQTFRSTGTITY
jgi:hypothetical protein